MKLFTEKQRSNEYTIIIGCGRLGANLANTLSEEDGNVLIIDKEKDALRKLSPSFGGLTITGDATDFDVLHEAQFEKASVVVVVTNDDSTNIMVAQIAREMFKINRVIARLYDLDRECVYREFNIDTICPAILSVKEIDKILSKTSPEDEICEVRRI